MHFYQNDGDAKADLISGKIGGFIDGPWQSGDLSRRPSAPSWPWRRRPDGHRAARGRR